MMYVDKLREVSKMYLQKCTSEPVFGKKGFSTSFWKVRGFFYKQDPDVVNVVFDYLQEKEDDAFLTLYKVIELAKKRQTDLRWKEAKELIRRNKQEVEPYSFDMLMKI